MQASFVRFLLLHAFLLPPIIISKSLSDKLLLPKIEVEFLCTFDDDSALRPKCLIKDSLMDNKTFTSFPSFDTNSNTLILNDDETVYVGMQCVASYPVEWVHFQEQWLTLTDDNWAHLLGSRGSFFMRTVQTLDDVSTFRYTSIMSLNNIKTDSVYVSGRYICQSMNDTRTSVEMTVYRNRKVFGQVFPLSGKSVTVWTNDQNDETIILPCYTAYPNITVNLYRQRNEFLTSKESMAKKSSIDGIETWDKIYPSDQLWFKSDQGFIYSKRGKASADDMLSNFQLSPGTYKCIVVDQDNKETDECVIVNLVHGSKPEEPIGKNHIIDSEGKASFNYSLYDSNIIQIDCSSNSSAPPNLYLISCFTKDACNRQMKHLSALGNHSHGQTVNRLSKTEGNCRKSLNMSHLSIPLNVKCIGDGVDYSETFIFPVEGNKQENKTEPYFRWEDVDPYKMVSLIPVEWNEKSLDKEKILLYKNQSVSFQCLTSTAYFAIGSKVTLDYKNGTQILAQDEATHKNILVKFGFPKYFLNISFRVAQEMASISCYAAIVNSSKWIKKTMMFQVEDGEVAKIVGNSDVEEIYWTLNNTSNLLKCEFSGVPVPLKVQWRKDNQVITFTNDSKNKFNHTILNANTSILLIHVANYETHGQYECVVGNMFGTATKIFRVYVRESESRWIFMSTSLGLSCFIVAFIFLGIYTWREKVHTYLHKTKFCT